MLLHCTARIINAKYPLLRTFSGHLAETLATLLAGETEEALLMAGEDFAFLVIETTDYPEAVEFLGCKGLRIVPTTIRVEALEFIAPDLVIATLTYTFPLKIADEFESVGEAYAWLLDHQGFAQCISAGMTTVGRTDAGCHMGARSREGVTLSFAPIEQ